MKFLNKLSTTRLITAISETFIKKGVRNNPILINIDNDDTGVVDCELQGHTFTIFTKPINQLTINLTNTDLSHETYIYAQFTTGEEPKLPTVKPVIWANDSNNILEKNSTYILEIQHVNNKFFANIKKYSKVENE